MEDVHREADQRALVERRLRDEEIGEMSGAEQRIVEQDRVAGRKGARRMRGERVLHRERHRAHVTGTVRPLRHHPSFRIEDGDGKVLALARLLRIRRLVHGRSDLDGDGLERAPDHAEGDRIDGCAHRISSNTGSGSVPGPANSTMRFA